MQVTFGDILKNAMFTNSRIIAGEEGISRKVKRISVFDCKCEENRIDKGIYKEGDLFITCLDQFAVDQSGINTYFRALGETKSAGLLIVTDELLGVIGQDVINYCNSINLPVVVVYDELTYAEIIDVCNRYITSDNLNTFNALKLEKIMYGKISQSEKMEVLYSINSNIKGFVRCIFVEGDFISDIEKEETFSYHANSRNDIYVRTDSHMIFILSAESEKELRKHTDVVTNKILDFIKSPTMGFSRIYPRREIARLLEEGMKAIETARTLDIKRQSYDPMSSLQLLLNLKDSEEAVDFYNAYVNAISEKVSEEALKDLLITIECFVASSGSFSETAEKMNQHVNTIRYRVNKVKEALKMENDTVKFYETIALASKLRILINREI